MTADTFTPNRNYITPATGNDVNTWGTLLNGNFTLIDLNISGEATIATTGGTTNITQTEAENVAFVITGALSENASIVMPATKGFYLVINQTTGGYSLVFSASGGGSDFTMSPEAETSVIYSDGTNVYGIGATAQPAGTPIIPSGSAMPFFNSVAPTGWTQSTAFNDAVIRLVSDGSAGTNGGAWAVSGLTVQGTALTIDQMPNHDHGIGSGKSLAYDLSGGTGGGSGTFLGGIAFDPQGNGNPHTHGITSDGTWRPSYVNALIAVKN